MIALDLDAVVLADFKSFSGEHTLDIEDLGIGLHYVRGSNHVERRLESNGAGKTTLVDAIQWCLYGRTASGLKNPDVTPWQGGKTFVEVYLTKNEQSHCVRRTISPNKLTLDGDIVSQPDLDAFLGITFELFTNTVVLGQGEPLFFDLEPRRKMEILSTVLGLDKWDERAAKASQAANELERKSATIEGRLRSSKDALADLDDAIVDLKTKAKDWDTRRNEQMQRRTEDQDKLRKRYESMKDKADKAALEYDGAATELAYHVRERGNLTEYKRGLLLEKAEAESKTESRKRDLAVLQKQLRGIKDGSACPTCGEPMKASTLRRHRDELAERIDELRTLIKAGVPSGITSAIEDLDRQLADNAKNEANFRKKSEKADADLRYFQREASTLKGQLDAVEALRVEMEREDNPYADQVTEQRKTRKELSAVIVEAEKRLRINAKRIERTRFWSKGFKDVRLYLVESVLEEMEYAINAMLDDVGLIDWTVTLDVERETKSGTVQRGLNVMIQSPRNNKPVKWEAWSGGEEQRLRILGALALSDTLLAHAGVTCGFEWLDEPSSHMTAGGVRDLCDVLADRARRMRKQIMLVDHLAIESSRFTSVLSVIKDADGSHIRQ